MPTKTLSPDYLANLLGKFDIGDYVQKGERLFQEYHLTPSELSNTLETTDATIKGFSEIYFFTYLEILRIIDEDFVKAVSQAGIDVEAVKKEFLTVIASLPEELLSQLSKPKKIQPLKNQLDVVIPNLIENLKKINDQIPDRIRDLFTQREKEISDLFLRSGNNFDPNLATELASLCHRWIEEKDSHVDSYVRALVSQLNAEKTVSKTGIPPLSDQEGLNCFPAYGLFLPSYHTRTPIPSFVLLSQLHIKASETNQAGAHRQISLAFYDAAQGLPVLMRKFSHSVGSANMLVFAIQNIMSIDPKK